MVTDINHVENKIKNNNYNDAENFLKEFKKNWKSSKNIWDLFINNEEIDNIDEEIVKCQEYIHQKNKEESIISIKVIKQKYRSILERKSLKIKNII